MKTLASTEGSRTVFKVSLVTPAKQSVQGGPPAALVNQTPTPSQRVLCELQVIGSPKRKPLAPSIPASTGRTSRRSRFSIDADLGTSDVAAGLPAASTLAQWSFSAEELRLPVSYSDFATFRDRPRAFLGKVAELARGTTVKIFRDWRANALIRSATARTWLPSGSLTMPHTMLRQLSLLLETALPEGEALWLELSEPAGYLPVLPWEQMLRPATAAPILRLSPHPLRAVSPLGRLSVVLCLSVPSRAWLPGARQFACLLRHIREALPADSTLNVFADDLCCGVVIEAREHFSETDDEQRTIKHHDLPPASSSGQPCPEAWPDDAWLTWIMHSLNGAAVDILHCIAPAALLPDDARLVVARNLAKPEPASPVCPNARLLRYITPRELSESLTRLGAWAAILSTPLGRANDAKARSGLRVMAHQLARLRPAVAVFHDLEDDSTGADLAILYKTLGRKGPGVAWLAPAVSMYCHPSRVEASVPGASFLPKELLQPYRAMESLIVASTAGGAPLPAWLAATQRTVEQSISQAAAHFSEGANHPAVRGLASALREIGKIVNANCQKEGHHEQKAADAFGEEK